MEKQWKVAIPVADKDCPEHWFSLELQKEVCWELGLVRGKNGVDEYCTFDNCPFKVDSKCVEKGGSDNG